MIGARSLPLAAGILAAITALAAGCGSGQGEDPELVVFAAASLAPAFESYADEFGEADVLFSFAGSDALAAQIRQGLEPDVFAAANTELPEALASEGLLDAPTTFAANELVLATPAGSTIQSLGDLAEPGVGVGIGAEDVPVGEYTRQVLAQLPPEQNEAILDNVRTSEPDVAGIVGKLNQGAVDAGFVYASDVAASGGALVAVPLPASMQPAIAYGVGVGAASESRTAAESFIAGLLDGAGREALAESGLLPPPPETGR